MSNKDNKMVILNEIISPENLIEMDDEDIDKVEEMIDNMEK